MEDLAAAYAFLKKHENEFEIDADRYAVGGFSAGGHLAASWGLPELGYKKYHYPAPELLLLGYPLLSVWRTLQLLPENYQQAMLNAYLGADHSEKTCKPYNIDEMAADDYPAVFMIQAENDDVVPIWNTAEFFEKLKERRVPCEYEHPKTGGHGFGLGSETEAKDWIERAVTFWKKLCCEN